MDVQAENKVLQGEIADLAVLQTLQHGAGALWVSKASKRPAYLSIDKFQPPAFREAFQKTWDEDGEKSAFMVLQDEGNLHVMKVPRLKSSNTNTAGTV